MSEQVATSRLQEAIETVEALPPDDQALLIEIVQRRLIEQRRREIAYHAQVTLQALKEGQAQSGTVKDLRQDLLDEA
jgi:hypothetical protein